MQDFVFSSKFWITVVENNNSLDSEAWAKLEVLPMLLKNEIGYKLQSEEVHIVTL